MAKKRKKSQQPISTATNISTDAADIDDIFAKKTKVEETTIVAANGLSSKARTKIETVPPEKVVKTSAKVVETPTTTKKSSSKRLKAPIDDDFANSRGTGKSRFW